MAQSRAKQRHRVDRGPVPQRLPRVGEVWAGGETAGHSTSAIKILRLTATKAKIEFLNRRTGPTTQSSKRGAGHRAGAQQFMDLAHLVQAYRPVKGD